METLLGSKAKAVISASVFLLSVLLSHHLRAQSGPDGRITISCNECLFTHMLSSLEKQGGIHFIYSTNIGESQRPVTINSADKSVDEVLSALERVTGLTFRRTGKHVVIKETTAKLPDVPERISHAAGSAPGKISGPERTLSDTDTGSFPVEPDEPMDSVKIRMPVMREVTFGKPPVALSAYFNPARLPDLPAQYVRSLNLRNNHPGWFVSAGLSVNNYSVGAELRAGLRSVYLVYRPAWLNDRRYHPGYGIGTSILLTDNFSWNTIYSYAVLDEEALSGEFRIAKPRISYRHHSVRVMFNYALTRKIDVQAGPSINLLDSRFDRSEAGYAPAVVSFPVPPRSPALTTFPFPGTVVKRIEPVQAAPLSRMWMGWEATVSYRLSFFRKR